MNISTKYRIGQQVWFKWCGELILAPIIDIHIHCYLNEINIRYNVDYYDSKYPLVPLPEECLFLTKRELLNSIEL